MQHYLFKKKLNNQMDFKKFIFQFSFFSVASVSSFFIDLALFLILTFLGTNFLISQGIARAAGGITSFFINRHFSFKNKNSKFSSQARRFLLLYITSYCLALFLLNLTHEQLDVPIVFAKLFADGFCFIFNFVIMRYFVYASSKM